MTMAKTNTKKSLAAWAVCLAVVIVGVLLTGCGPAGHRLKFLVPATGPGTALGGLRDALVKPEPQVETFEAYVDVSKSDFPNAMAAWPDLEGRVAAFLETAAPDSRVEVSVTGPVAGRPARVLDVVVPRLPPAQRKALVAQARSQLNQAHDALVAHHPAVTGSYLIEDLRRLADRGGGLPGASCRLIAYSDGEFFSGRFHAGHVLDGTPAQRAQVLARITAELPRMAHPPASFTFAYLPSVAGQANRAGNESEVLGEFLRQVVVAWGTPEKDTTLVEPACNGPVRVSNALRLRDKRPPDP